MFAVIGAFIGIGFQTDTLKMSTIMGFSLAIFVLIIFTSLGWISWIILVILVLVAIAVGILIGKGNNSTG
jgi:hypothetical protein